MAETLSLIGNGFTILLTQEGLTMLFVGTIIGIVAGSIPGLSSSNTTAILLPMTLAMSPQGALIFLGSIYVGCQYGGSIPAILFNTPGTTGASATTLDGFPLARQGKAAFALAISLTASCVSGMIAAAISILIMKPAATLAYEFGPAEVFLLALVGIIVIVAVSDKNIPKGLLAGVTGLLMACMSMDANIGQARLTFGRMELYDGLPLVAVLVGMFALPSMIALVGEDAVSRVHNENVGRFKETMEGVVFTFKNWINMVRSCIIGTIVGIIPGAGIDIAAFLSYGQAKVWSKSPETFGQGNPEGIVAAEASNNAVCGGALVPSIALGIPGSGTTAIMLAALTLHRINPGPSVMRVFQNEVYAIFLAIFFANLILWPMGLFYTRWTSKLSITNPAYLVPAIVCVCIVGAYATRTFIFDVVLFIIFGLLGYLMIQNKFPLVPFILGVVMGKIAEENFIVSYRLSQGSADIFFKTPLAIALWIINAAVLILPTVLAKIKEKRRAKSAG